MDKYIQKWFDIIEQMKNSNTYKLAWGRSILEISMNKEYEVIGDNTIISFHKIAEKFLKYYWNQTYFFNLKQGPINSEPAILSVVKDVINYYKLKMNTNTPVWFNRIEHLLKSDKQYYHKIINQIAIIINQNVSWRFLNTYDSSSDIYTLEPQDSSVKNRISIKSGEMNQLVSYAPLLIQLINYKWVQLLESYNRSPRIASKVRGSQQENINRKSLTKYKEILLQQFEDRPIVDFYTGKVLDENDISIDHVIPWSFMYSDDIWNLVVTSKSQNSVKSNHIPNKEAIDRLKQQNMNLLLTLHKETTVWNQLNEAISNNYIDKYYMDFKI